MGKLDGKVIIVTGSTKGIGKGIAVMCAQEGAKVVVSGRSVSEGNGVVADIRQLGGEAIFVRTDVSKEADCKALIDSAISTFGKLDGLVNNSGVFPNNTLLDITEEDYEWIYGVNIKGSIFCAKYALLYMTQNGGGSIVNVGTTHYDGGGRNMALYSTSKGAMYTLTNHIARSYAEDHVRCNWITVGWVISEGEWDRILSHDENNGLTPEEYMEKWKNHIPMGRLQTAEDMAQGAVFFLSDASEMVTGSNMKITGGFNI